MSATTTRPPEVMDWEPVAGSTGKLTAADPDEIGRSRRRQHAADETTRRLRGRLMRFAIFIPLWALSVTPLAREISDGREVVLAYLAVGAVSLGVVIALRGVYVLLTRRKKILAPSAFLIAAVLALASYVVQTGGEEEVPLAGAAAQEFEVRGSSG